MAEISRTFSELWYRVMDFTPRLSAHLVVRRQAYRRQTWFVIGDPAGSKFYRFNGAAYRFLGLFDGQRTVNEAWEVCNAQLGDEAPTQRDCLDLLAQLQMFGLLRNDLPIDVQRLRERYEQVRDTRHKELTGNYVFWTVPILNPERFLQKYANVARVVFSRWGVLVLCIVMALAIRDLVPRGSELYGGLNKVISIDNLFLLSISFLVLKVIHEFGHAFCCKAYGGRVTEMGIMFMIVLPIPYCDATASWAFSNKWHRIFVSAAGVMSELVVASIAAIIWARTDAGTVHTVAYNVMFVASVATFLFNINPLLRYDGYYILADLTEIPNLAPRSYELLKWMARKYLFGVKGEPRPQLRDKEEGAIMVTHAFCAFPYRLLVMIGIVMFVAQKYFVFGLLLGIFGAIMWLIVPVVKGMNYVLTEASLQAVRVRAVAVTFGLAILGIGFIGVVPMPARVRAPGVIEPLNRQTYRAPQRGFVQDVPVRNGQFVKAGQSLVHVFDRFMQAQHERAVAGVQLERIRRDAAAAQGTAQEQMAEYQYKVASERLDAVAHVMDEMDVRAQFDGYVIAPEIHTLEGEWVDKGQTLAMVATLDDLVLRVLVDDRDFAWLFPKGLEGAQQDGSVHVAARMMDRPGVVVPLMIDVERSGHVGTHQLEYQALSGRVRGGKVATDPSDSRGQRTLTPQWLVTLRPAQGTSAFEELLPGTRAVVRFSRPAEPLAFQWVRRIRQGFARRFEL